MRIYKINTLFIIAALLINFLMCSKKEEAVESKLLFIKGEVTITRASNSIGCKIGDVLQKDDIIRTGERSLAVIQIGDKATATLSSKTTITVKDLQNHYSEFYLDQGEVVSNVKKLEKNENYVIKTKTIVASVRGTQFLVRSDEKFGKVAVNKGTVNVSFNPENIKNIVPPEIPVVEGKMTIINMPEEIKEPKIELQEISFKDKIKIETISTLDVTPQTKTEETESKKTMEQILQKATEIEEIDTLTEKELKQKVKQKKIEKLIMQKTRTIEEIKEACERIDNVMLYSGKIIQGAIISRGDSYKILTTNGIVEVEKNKVRTVSIVK